MIQDGTTTPPTLALPSSALLRCAVASTRRPQVIYNQSLVSTPGKTPTGQIVGFGVKLSLTSLQ